MPVGFATRLGSFLERIVDADRDSGLTVTDGHTEHCVPRWTEPTGEERTRHDLDSQSREESVGGGSEPPTQGGESVTEPDSEERQSEGSLWDQAGLGRVALLGVGLPAPSLFGLVQAAEIHTVVV